MLLFLATCSFGRRFQTLWRAVNSSRETINYSNLDLFDIPAGDPNKKNCVRLRDKGV